MRGGLLGFRTEAVALLAPFGFVCLVRFENLVRVRVAIANLQALDRRKRELAVAVHWERYIRRLQY